MKLFRTITELVDRDVATNFKPLSIVGMVIPVLPFMLFVDHIPANDYPILLGMASSLGMLWGVFFLWCVLRHLRSEISGRGAWYIMIGAAIFVLLLTTGYIWLTNEIGWPEAYGFHCHRRCFFQNLANSPKLISGGGGYELGLFVVFWLLPVALLGLTIYALLKRFKRRNRILPME